MIRRYCDLCDVEMTERNTPHGGQNGGRISIVLTTNRNGRKLGLEVMQSIDNTANDGDVCKYCILDALYELDDRPRAALKGSA